MVEAIKGALATMEKYLPEAAIIGIVISSLMQILPPIAAVLGVIWWGLRIYQTRLEIKKLKERSNNGRMDNST